MTAALGAEASGAVERAADALRESLVVALPTDTVYGLAALPGDGEAVRRLFAIKGRPPEVAVPVLVGDEGQARSLATSWPRAAGRLADRWWPGPLTLVVPTRPALARRLGALQATAGLRQPAHRFVEALCLAVGPLAVTSANRHGEAPCQTADEVAAALGSPAGSGGAAPALIVDGGRCAGVPSTVVDCTEEPPRCLRSGAVAWPDVMAIAG